MGERPGRLVRIRGDAGRPEVVLREETTVGRRRTNTLQIMEPPVSKVHATIQMRPETGVYVLKDLDSRNGTFVNGEQLTRPHVLREGDQVRFGISEWRFEGGERQAEPRVARPGPRSTLDSSPDAVGDTETVDLDALVGGEDGAGSPQIAAAKRVEGAPAFVPADELDDQMVRDDYDKLRQSYMLADDLHGQTDIGRMCDRILEHIFEWLNVDRGVVLLMKGELTADDESQRWEDLEAVAVRIRPGVGWEEHGYGSQVPRSILRHAVDRREATLSSDALSDARMSSAQSVVLQGIRSSLTVPMIARDRVVGVLHADSMLTTGLFTPKDLSILEVVARQAAMSIDNVQMQVRIKDETRARESLSRMLSPNLVEEILSGALPLVKGGELRTVTVLFADVRGFTELTEWTPAGEMVAMMNDYFERVTRVIFEYRGTLDKYIGDAVMALWGAPITGGEDEDECNAVRAAIGMQAAVDEFNDERRADGEIPIGVGIGIATGRLIAGYMGSTETLSYTVLGRSVNLAARLCGRATAGEILLGPLTFKSVVDMVEVEELEALRLKGIKTPVVPRRVLGLA